MNEGTKLDDLLLWAVPLGLVAWMVTHNALVAFFTGGAVYEFMRFRRAD